MLSYIVRRLGYMVVVLFLVSVVCFYIINLPPGSYIETFATQLDAAGSPATQAQLDYLTIRYGLDQPLHVQYLNWIVPLVTQGDYGYSFEWQQPVWTLLADRLWLTIAVSIVSMPMRRAARGAAIGLQPLENLLRVMEHRGARIHRQRLAGGDPRIVPALPLGVADHRHMIGEDAAETGIDEPSGALMVFRGIRLAL